MGLLRRDSRRTSFDEASSARRFAIVLIAVITFAVVSVLVGGLRSDGDDGKHDSRSSVRADERLQTFEKQGFSILFPESPQRTSREMQTAQGTFSTDVYFAYDSLHNGVALSVARRGKAVIDLDLSAKGAAEALGGDLRSTQPLTQQGYPARDYQVDGELDGKVFTMFGRTIDVNGRLYQVQYLVLGAHIGPVPNAFEKIADSLRFG